MARRSAGILPYRRRAGALEVLLVHPGGPFWARRDTGAWSIAKGEYAAPEDSLAAALREWQEETGIPLAGPFHALRPVRLKSGKVVEGWATPADIDTATFTSNTFELEYPAGSGRIASFPEIDRIGWFDLETASRKINPGQVGMLVELAQWLG